MLQVSKPAGIQVPAVTIIIIKYPTEYEIKVTGPNAFGLDLVVGWSIHSNTKPQVKVL